jgi:serine/threonine protein kinase
MCDKLKLEVRALKLLSHPNITSFFGVVDTKTEIFLILELCSGKDLFEMIT